MEEYLIGTKNHGCYINNIDQTLTFYDLLNLVEKLKGKKQKYVFHYQDIEKASITYGIQDFFRSGTITIMLVITLKNNDCYDVPILFNDTKKVDFIQFVKVLQESPIKIIDPYNILHSITHSQQTIWEIISNIEKERMQKHQHEEE